MSTKAFMKYKVYLDGFWMKDKNVTKNRTNEKII